MNKTIKPIWDDNGLTIQTKAEEHNLNLETLSIEQLIKLKKQVEEEIGKRPLIPLEAIITDKDIEKYNNKEKATGELVYVKDNEGYVTLKPKSEVLADETIITKEEWEELSGMKYYEETFEHGGKRKGIEK